MSHPPQCASKKLCLCCSLMSFSAILPALLGGCAPTLSITPLVHTGPTIAELENHITCVMADALDTHLEGQSSKKYTVDQVALWRRLVDYDFSASINITVFVTQTEGLNPSFNFITPLTNLGNPILKTVESSNGLTNITNATGTPNANNLTLSVGLQLDGSQDRNFVLNYLLDFHELWSDMHTRQIKDGRGVFHTREGILQRCTGTVQDTHFRKPGGIPYGLKGDLALEETLEAGLESLQNLRYYPGAGQGKPGGPQQSAAAAASQTSGLTTGFSTKVDFNLLWGVNGGPNWTLLDFKGPGGGSGGGGAGGGAAGGGNGGGGAGGGAQLVNFNRSKTDTFIATFVPTCRADSENDVTRGPTTVTKLPTALPTGVKQYVFHSSASWTAKSKSQTAKYEVFLNADLSKVGGFSDPNGAIIVAPVVKAAEDTDGRGKTYGLGNVAWAGIIYNTSGAPTMSIRGTVTSLLTGQLLGYVDLEAQFSPGSSTFLNPITLKPSASALETVIQDRLDVTDDTSADYWSTIPPCSQSQAFAAGQLAAGANNTQLQRLPPNTRFPLLQSH